MASNITSLLQIDVVMARVSAFLDRQSTTRLRVPSRTWRDSARSARISVVVWDDLLVSRCDIGVPTLRRNIAPHYVVTTLILIGRHATRTSRNPWPSSSDIRIITDAVAACRDGRDALTPPRRPMSASEIDRCFATVNLDDDAFIADPDPFAADPYWNY